VDARHKAGHDELLYLASRLFGGPKSLTNNLPVNKPARVWRNGGASGNRQDRTNMDGSSGHIGRDRARTE
jgi:hypothetical protein